MIKPYMVLGIILTFLGFILSSISYFFFGSVPITSTCVSMVILGMTCLGLAFTDPDNRGVKGIISKTNNILLITLALVFGVVLASLAWFKQGDLTIYFVIDAIAYYIVSWIFIAQNPRLKTALSVVGAIVFIGFLVVMVAKIIYILK